MRARATVLLFCIFAQPLAADIIGGNQDITFNGFSNASSTGFTVPGGVTGISFTAAGAASFGFDFSSGLTSRLVLTIDLFSFGMGNQPLSFPVDWNFNSLTFDGDSLGVLDLTFLPGSSTPGVTDPTANSSFTDTSITIQTAAGDNPGPQQLQYAFDVATVPEPRHFFVILLAVAAVVFARKRSNLASVN